MDKNSGSSHSRKVIAIVSAVVFVVVLVAILWLVKFRPAPSIESTWNPTATASPSNSSTTAGQQSNVKCPTDYCLNPVKGAGSCPDWTGVNATYYEQECYKYPENAQSSVACEQQRVVYYKVCGVAES